MRKILTTFGLIFAGISILWADIIEVSPNGKVTGKLETMDAQHAIFRASNSQVSLDIKVRSIKRIIFPENKNLTHYPEMITLTNGDILPCRVLEMQEGIVSISTNYAGSMSIKRDKLSMIQFGITKEEIIDSSIDGLDTWKKTSGSWISADDAFLSQGRGTITRHLNMPENVRFRFIVKQEENVANFTFRFCSDRNSNYTGQNTYELRSNASEVKIFRYQKRGHNPITLASFSIQEFTDKLKETEYDIHLYRAPRNTQVKLFINRRHMGTWFDPSPKKPQGNYLSFNNWQIYKGGLKISKLRISRLNKIQNDEILEKKPQFTSDVLFINQGEVISGWLQSIVKKPDGGIVCFLKNKYATKPLDISLNSTASLYLHNSNVRNVGEKKDMLFSSITLSNGASLKLYDIKISKDTLKAQHPLLGQYTMNIEDLLVIEPKKKHNEPTE